MAGKGPAIVILAVSLLSGCHSSASLSGRTDATADTPPEPAADLIHDCPEHVPEPGGPGFTFSLDGIFETGSMDIEMDCVVTELELLERARWFITLGCPGPSGEIEEHEVFIIAIPHVWLLILEGEGVTLRYVSQVSRLGLLDRWLALSHTDGRGLVVGVMDAEIPTPPGREEFYRPLSIRAADEDWCPVIDAGCFSYERVAVTIGIDDSEVTLADSTIGHVGGLMTYAIQVETALAFSDIDCGDTPVADSDYEVLLFMTERD